ncbi:Mo-dependent nitrogenase C-terminal domain family protein [Planktothrix serta PCC 8927]|uniref:Mo-dependent nitrogenase C-terminal domain family protein n=2 Tax=Planktothrix TaxID=54304 RepID=A0A7Z9DYI8_9CYAN|nr:Mo-dependent nitrogenase C-terminal domain family protein [Planktothrix serta PCC 8927]
MNFPSNTMSYLTFVSRGTTPVPSAPVSPSSSFDPFPSKRRFTPLRPIRNWLESIKIQDPKFAHRLCELIPSQCPFERDIKLFGHLLFHIPPLCKLNPFYEELVSLRFQALCYLADECGEDISAYC